MGDLPDMPEDSQAAPSGPSTAEDLDEMRKVFTNERFAPELLPHRDELVRRVRLAVDEQARAMPAAPCPIFCRNTRPPAAHLVLSTRSLARSKSASASWVRTRR